MSEMLEKVARSIIAARAGDAAADYAQQWDNANWREALRQARAAVEALREPSEGMVEAWSDAEEGFDHPTEYYLNRSRYAAMIDHILKEG